MWQTTLLIAALLLHGSEKSVRGTSLELSPYQARAIQVAGDGTTMDLVAGSESASYLLIVGSLSRSGETSLTLRASPVSDSQPLPPLPSTAHETWRARVTAQKQEMQAQRESARNQRKLHVVSKLPAQRSFHLFVREDDFLDRQSYQEVLADLVQVGEHCVVYVDVDDLDNGFPQEVADEVVEIFDRHVLPNARKLYGDHLDIDRNGKFTILFTHWLGNLSNGKVSIGGFVRGSDFLSDLSPPFSNQCDMMYLNSSLRPGEHLRTLVAHEYTHAVTFSEHTYGEYLPGSIGEDEETWLSEAMAHLAENFIGSGWSNLDYRISAYLNAPHRYQLVVPDYYRAGLWRCHGSRGATYLFLRWCVDKFGPQVLLELSKSNLQGVENLEAATLTPFEELFRAWSVATCLSGISPAIDEEVGFQFIDLRDRLETRALAGPRFFPVTPGNTEVSLQPTSWSPFLFRVPKKSVMRVAVSAASQPELQLTLVRLADEMPDVELLAEVKSPERGRLVLRHHDGPPVHWIRMTVEPESLSQTKTAEDPPPVAIVDLERTLKQASTGPGTELRCPPFPIDLQGDQRRVAKVLGIDAEGNKVAVWATIEPPDAEISQTARITDGTTLSR